MDKAKIMDKLKLVRQSCNEVESLLIKFPYEQMGWPPKFVFMPVVRAGERIRGEVHLEVKEAIKARAVEIKAYGEAKVEWHDPRMKNTSKAKRVYLDNSLKLWTPPAGHISAGIYTYPFEFYIPANCPPTFERMYGEIRYNFTASIVRPWRCDTKKEKIFVVYGKTEKDSKKQEPVEQTIEKHQKTCLFIGNGRISTKVSLEKSYFTPGETISILLRISNLSGRKIVGIKAKLVEETIFYLWGKDDDDGKRNCFSLASKFFWSSYVKRFERQKVAETTIGESALPLDGNEIVQKLDIKVPAKITPTIDNCDIIQFHYVLKINLKTNGSVFHRNGGKCKLPIHIGAIDSRSHKICIPI